MRISSTRNPVVRYVRGLERASARRADGVYIAEGVRLLTEAIDTGQEATIALYDPAALERSAAGSFLLSRLPAWAERSYEVDPQVLSAAAQTEHPAGALAVLRFPFEPPLTAQSDARLGVVLDAVADPGNAGTIVRTAAAAGVGYVVALAGSADLFAPKVVRAGMGAHFRLPLYCGVTWDEVRAELRDVPAVALEADGGVSIYAFRWPDRALLVVGSEAHGLSPEVRAGVKNFIHIPMRAGVESLNASVAAAIVIYSHLGPSIP